MVLEAFLLLSAFLVASLQDGGPFVAALFLIVALILCIPAFTLLKQGAPPFVPTSRKTVQEMIELAEIKPGEIVYDLGCGDGRLLIAAAKKGAKSIGYELSLLTLLLAKWNTRNYPTISVRYGDFWQKNLQDADVIVCYLLLDKMKEFEEKIWPTLKPGTRVVSHAFPMPTVKPVKKEGRAIMYIK
jgi:cyclopropane fatty-acyl-phospholipid synthase-like methyltransferase